MKYTIILLFVASWSFAQDYKTMEKWFEEDSPVKVMILGTFHFDNPGLDSHKNLEVPDVMDETRQSEINKMIDMLKAFNPDKIALELLPEYQDRMNNSYQAYKTGNLSLERDERYQLGFRLAGILEHSEIYGIDAPSRHYESHDFETQTAYESEENKYIQLAFSEKPWTTIWYPIYEQCYAYQDSLSMALSLIDYHLFLNQADRINRSHGIYLVDSFKFGIGTHDEKEMYFGADMKTSWYNRNLRIFQNIIRITDQDDDRILVIIGSGHLPILKHCIQASPEYEWVDVSDFLKK